MKKKLIALLLLSIIVTLSTSYSVFADDLIVDVHNHSHEENTEPILLRAMPCDCGGAYSFSSYTYGPWSESSQRLCTHNNWGVDRIGMRVVLTNYKCSRGCGRGYSTSSTQQEIICAGYN